MDPMTGDSLSAKRELNGPLAGDRQEVPMAELSFHPDDRAPLERAA
jgi:hypothetical protein